mgnify:CR=1 FL=1
MSSLLTEWSRTPWSQRNNVFIFSDLFKETMMMFLFSATIAIWFAINRKERENRVEKAGRWLAVIAAGTFFLGAFLSMIQAFTLHKDPYSPLLSCDDDFFTENTEGARTVYQVASGFMSTAAVVVSVISIAAMTIVFSEPTNDGDYSVPNANTNY